jgi:hypothetical protein
VEVRHAKDQYAPSLRESGIADRVFRMDKDNSVEGGGGDVLIKGGR